MSLLKIPLFGKIPAVGLGTWRSPDGQVQTAVKHAIKAGYRHIDAAYVYGNEAEVGQAVKEALQEGIVKREELFIVSKLWNTEHEASKIEPAFRQTLTKLGLDYLDLYVIHWPVSWVSGEGDFPKNEFGAYKTLNTQMKETWQALEKLHDQGLVKNLGISNFSIEETEELLSYAKVRPICNQVEIHPYLPQDRLGEYCKKHDIILTGYCPLGNLDPSDEKRPSPIRDETVLQLAKKYNKSPAQIVLRWSTQKGYVPLPKSTNPSRLVENASIFDFEMTAEDMAIMAKLGERHIRYVNPCGRPPCRNNITPDHIHDWVSLYNGAKMPCVGFGTWRSEPGKVAQAVKDAIDAGYRHIDCAAVYQNEVEVGSALKEAIQSGKVKREDLWITSKLWNTEHEAARVEPALRKTLSDLGLEYLDLYLMHWPTAFKPDAGFFPKNAEGHFDYVDVPVKEAWQEMERLQGLGLIKNIGISNFSIEEIEDLLSYAKVRPAVNQVEAHPYFPQDDLNQYCASKFIRIQAYSPLANFDPSDEKAASPLKDAVVLSLAKKYNKSAAQVLIRWSIQKGFIPLPKSVTTSRIQENAGLFDFALTEEDMAELAKLGVPAKRFANPPFRAGGKPTFPTPESKL